MSTRSVIGRPTPEGGFHGTYCHYDGYPAHQGRILFDAVTGHFAGDTDVACSYLIDEHPAGWSVLHGDFTTPPGYRLSTDSDDRRNQCYCHGDRQDPPRPPLDDHSAHDAWVEYAYVIAPDRLQVLADVEGGWQPVAEPAWTDTPDWDAHRHPRQAPAPPVLTRPLPIDTSNPTSTASTLAGATSGRGLQGKASDSGSGRGASAHVLQPGPSVVAAALRSRCAEAVQSGYGGRWELVLIIVWFPLHTSRVIDAPAPPHVRTGRPSRSGSEPWPG